MLDRNQLVPAEGNGPLGLLVKRFLMTVVKRQPYQKKYDEDEFYHVPKLSFDALPYQKISVGIYIKLT